VKEITAKFAMGMKLLFPAEGTTGINAPSCETFCLQTLAPTAAHVIKYSLHNGAKIDLCGWERGV
jgi:hypothetical protein